MARLHSPLAFLAVLTLLASPIRVPAEPEPLGSAALARGPTRCIVGPCALPSPF